MPRPVQESGSAVEELSDMSVGALGYDERAATYTSRGKSNSLLAAFALETLRHCFLCVSSVSFYLHYCIMAYIVLT